MPQVAFRMMQHSSGEHILVPLASLCPTADIWYDFDVYGAEGIKGEPMEQKTTSSWYLMNWPTGSMATISTGS